MVRTVRCHCRRRYPRLLALAVVVAAVTLLAGCGGVAQPTASLSPSPSTDPFTGTWRIGWADATFVISADSGQYTVLAVSPGLSGVTDLGARGRQGATLVCRVKTGEIAGDAYRFTLTDKPTALKVVELKKGESEPTRALAIKVSASTASPTPSPLQ